MSLMLQYLSSTFVQDRNVALDVGLLPATLDFGPGSLDIRILNENWPLDVVHSENYRLSNDVSRLHQLSYRSIRVIQQTTPMDYTVHSARQEVRIHFTSTYFANSFGVTLSGLTSERVPWFSRVTAPMLNSLIGATSTRHYYRLRTVHHLPQMTFWLNVAYPQVTPDRRSVFLAADIQAYQTVNAVALKTIIKLIHLDMGGCLAQLRTQLKVTSEVSIENLLVMHDYQDAVKKYGKAKADRMFGAAKKSWSFTNLRNI